MISWKQKLSSRKLWAAILGFVVALCAVFGLTDATTQQIVAVVGALGVLVAYIFAEDSVDKARANPNIETVLELLGVEETNSQDE